MRNLAAALLALALALPGARAQEPAAAPLKAEEMEQLAAPIALYPDALVAQILMAATYPLEVVQAARWSKANPGLKDKALEDALEKQTWEASVKSLAAFPQVLAMMNEKLDWTQKLGDAFLGQQQEVMDAIQRLRRKAHESGNLKSTQEQVVSAEKGADGTTVVKIEPADPKVVYVPAYDPMVVYAPWPYPAYPPYYYYPPGYVAGPVVWFSVGIIVGGALWGGCHWGHGGGVYISHHNHYNNFNRTKISDGSWNHKVEHRKGAQYRDAASRDKYGGGQRAGVDSREQFRGRAEAGRQDLNRASAVQRGGFDGGGRGGAFDGAGGRDAISHSNRGAASRGGMGGGGFSGGGMRGGMGGGMRGGGGRR